MKPGYDKWRFNAMFRRTLVIRICILIIACCMPLHSSFGKDGGRSLGLVVSMKGTVTISRESGRFIAYPSFILQVGDTIDVDKKSECSGFTPGGEGFRLMESERMILTARSGGGIDLWIGKQVADFVGEGFLKRLLARSGGEWSFASDVTSPILPVNKGKVRSSKPVFYWKHVRGIDKYKITILPSDGEEFSKIVSGFHTVLYELEPGATYDWRVEPVLDCWSISSEWKSFQVMTEDEERMLNNSLQGLSNLNAGVLLFVSGLCGEAIEQFDAAIESHESENSAFIWRAKALAAAGLHSDANEDILRVYESK